MDFNRFLGFQRKKILIELYDMPWYRLPVSFQKNVKCTIHSVQNGTVLGTGTLNEFDFEMASYVSTSHNDRAFPR